jgi:hypothetical protein
MSPASDTVAAAARPGIEGRPQRGYPIEERGARVTQQSGPLNGTFWQVETPDRRVPGVLDVTGDDLPVLETHQPIFTERKFEITRTPHGMTIAHSGDPEDLVADFQPRTVHGELADGTAVSVVDGQGGKTGSGFFDFGLEYHQRFRAPARRNG